MLLAALDVLLGLVAVRSGPSSVVLRLWESIVAADGSGFLPTVFLSGQRKTL
jgi:hypothetical protein